MALRLWSFVFRRLLPLGAKGLLQAHSVINSFIHSLSEPFPPTALRRRHAQTIRDRCSIMEWWNDGILEFWNDGMLEWWNYGWGIDGMRMMMMMIKNQWNGLMTVLTVSSILCYCRLSIDHLPLGVCLMYLDAMVCLASDGVVFHSRKYCKWGRNKALTKIQFNIYDCFFSLLFSYFGSVR